VEPTIRPLADEDLEGVVALSLAAWAPVFPSLEQELGAEVFRLLHPDWRAAQAAAVRDVCIAPEHTVWVAVTDGRPVGFVAVGEVDEGGPRAGEVVMSPSIPPPSARAPARRSCATPWTTCAGPGSSWR